MSRQPGSPEVRGIGVDPEGRCAHWHSERDIVAIQMKCCGQFYACIDCHQALAGHLAEIWPASEWHQGSVRCGACKTRLTITEYLACDHTCPMCHAPFNPRCQHHYHFYFAAKPR